MDCGYTVYVIQRKDDKKTYVGLTRRSLDSRIQAHIHNAMRKGHKSSPGSLPSAIRQTIVCGHRFHDVFTVRALEKGLSVDAARKAEGHWIKRLNASTPDGFNIFPGGSSVGGPANAKRAALLHPKFGKTSFLSTYSAIEFRNVELRDEKKDPLQLATVYARLKAGWTLEEALEYQPHGDGRSLREAFCYEGKEVHRLSEVSESTGVPVSTLRSRLCRAAAIGLTHPEIGQDRRKTGRQKRTSIRLPDPHGSRPGRTMDVTEFAQAAGVAKSTVLYRYHQLLRSGQDPEALADGDLIQHLTKQQDRRRILTLILPTGGTLRGGERELVRAILENQSLAQSRSENLGESAIRRRLRLAKCTEATAVSWAFGFSPKNKPAALNRGNDQ